LAVVGAEGIDQVLSGLADGTVTWTEQGDASTYAAKLCASDTLLDFSRPATAVHNQVRSLSPDIGARAATGGLAWKAWRSWPFGVSSFERTPDFAAAADGHPGRLAADAGRLFVGCAEGSVEVLQVQPAGKGKMPAADFLRGYAGRLGEKIDGAPDGTVV
jgi:methionyl-tRNA formyltransferase